MTPGTFCVKDSLKIKKKIQWAKLFGIEQNVLRRKFIAMSAYIKIKGQEDRIQIQNLMIHLRKARTKQTPNQNSSTYVLLAQLNAVYRFEAV